MNVGIIRSLIVAAGLATLTCGVMFSPEAATSTLARAVSFSGFLFREATSTKGSSTFFDKITIAGSGPVDFVAVLLPRLVCLSMTGAADTGGI